MTKLRSILPSPLSPTLLALTASVVLLAACQPAEAPTALPAPTQTFTTVPSTPTPAPTARPLPGGRWDTYTTDDGLPSNRIRALALDAEGQLWVGTDLSGGQLVDGTWVDIAPLETFDIAVDDHGRVWILDGRGVEVYEQGALTTHIGYADLGSNGDAILVDRQGRVWVGLFSGIALFEEGQWRNIDTVDLFGEVVWDMAEEPSGAILAAGAGGAARFDGSTWEPMTPPDQPATLTLNTVATDTSGRVWLGGNRVGAWVWDGEGWTQYTSADGLAGDTVTAIAFDGANRGWFGTNGGLSIFDGEAWTTLTVEDGLVHNAVRALAITDDGVWIGTRGGLSHLVFASDSE